MPNATSIPQRPDPVQFAARLNACLERFGYGDRGGAKRLAREYGVQPPVVSGWRSGRHLPAPAKVRQMAKVWHVAYDWLYWGEGPSPASINQLGARPADHKKMRDANIDTAVDDLRIAVSSLIALTAARRPDEAAALAAALRSQVEPKRLAEGLLPELLATLDAAGNRAAPPPKPPKP